MKKFPLALFAGFIPTMLLADVIWPGAILQDYSLSLYVIPFSLVIEFFIFWAAFRFNWWRTIIATLVANLASVVIGTIPIVGITMVSEVVTSPFFDGGTFITPNWILEGFVCVLINTIIEIFAIKLLYRDRVRLSWKVWLLVCIANAITVYLAYIAYGLYPKAY